MFKLFFLMFCLCFSFHSLSAQFPSQTSEFLRVSKENYEKLMHDGGNEQELHFVMGNESADLDSIVSSIAYAFLLSNENNHPFIPLINIYREELGLRKDVLFLFKELNISPKDLLFIDDVPLEALHAKGRLRLNLVDHNQLRPRQETLADSVERIVDHHADEKIEYPLLLSKEITVVGSTATLIAEKLLVNEQITLTHDLALMLLGPILIDTANLKSVEKTTERDTQAVERLYPLAMDMMPSEFYKKLLESKNDVTGLSPSMLMSKDFKEYLEGNLLYGISSIPSGVSWKREDIPVLLPIFDKYAKDRGLAFLFLLMNNDDPNGPKRKIMFYSHSKKLMEAFDAHIQTSENLRVLIPDPKNNDAAIHLYWAAQFISRKQLQPLFKFSENQELMNIINNNN